MPEAAEVFSEEDLIRQESVLISVTQGSYIKRTPLTAYRAQRRGGRGVQGMRTKDEDEVVDLYFARTLDHVLFFTNRGRVYGQRVFALPDAAATARGLPMVNFLNLAADERVTTLLVVPDFAQAEYVTLLTRMGRIKRVKLSEFAAVRPSGIIAMNLEPGDELGWVRATFGDQEFIIVTALAAGVCASEETEVRAMGRTAAGVRAIRLAEGDAVAGFDVVEPDGDLLVLTEHGWGKRTPLVAVPAAQPYVAGRLGAGARQGRTRPARSSPRASCSPTTRSPSSRPAGVALRTPVATISQQGRTARGVRIVNPDDGDTVAAMARLSAASKEPRSTEQQAKSAGNAAARRGCAAVAAAAIGQMPDERSIDGSARAAGVREQLARDRSRIVACRLSSLLRRGVGLQLEIMPEPSADALAETLVAFANGDGGTVLLGVDAQRPGAGHPAAGGRREPAARRA